MPLYLYHGRLSEAGETDRYRVVGSQEELITATLDLAEPNVSVPADGYVHAAISGAAFARADGAR